MRSGNGMMTSKFVFGSKVLLVSTLCSIGLSACGGDATSTFGNLLAFNKPSAPPLSADGKPIVNVDCPEVLVSDVGGTSRVFAGSDQSSNGVRYQFGIRETARECSAENGQIALKVGVSGRLLIGPAGQPGTYSVPLKIAVKREGTEGYAATKIYQVNASVPAGETGADFTVVSDLLFVPLIHEEAKQDYTIEVAFDTKAGRAAPVARARGKQARRRAAAAAE